MFGLCNDTSISIPAHTHTGFGQPRFVTFHGRLPVSTPHTSYIVLCRSICTIFGIVRRFTKVVFASNFMLASIACFSCFSMAATCYARAVGCSGTATAALPELSCSGTAASRSDRAFKCSGTAVCCSARAVGCSGTVEKCSARAAGSPDKAASDEGSSHGLFQMVTTYVWSM